MLNTKISNNAAKEGFNKEPKAMSSDAPPYYTFSETEINLIDQILQCLNEGPNLIDESMQITPSLDNLKNLEEKFRRINEEQKTCVSLANDDLISLFLFMNYTEDHLNLDGAVDLGTNDYHSTLEDLTDKLYNWKKKLSPLQSPPSLSRKINIIS